MATIRQTKWVVAGETLDENRFSHLLHNNLMCGRVPVKGDVVTERNGDLWEVYRVVFVAWDCYQVYLVPLEEA